MAPSVGNISSPRFYTPKNQSFSKNYHGCQRCQLPYTKWDSHPSTGWYGIFTFSWGQPREEPAQIVPLQERPLQGPPQPIETPKDTTPTGALVNNLLRTGYRSLPRWTHTTRQPIRTSKSRTLRQFSYTDRWKAPWNANSSSLRCDEGPSPGSRTCWCKIFTCHKTIYT